VRDRELVRTRSFVRVSGNLSLSQTEVSANIPPFNPQKLLTDGVASTGDDAPTAEPTPKSLSSPAISLRVRAKGQSQLGVCDLTRCCPK
jgi:hypothetical protein